jgi:hypothetical protein
VRWVCVRGGTWNRDEYSLNTHLATKALEKRMQRLSAGRNAG